MSAQDVRPHLNTRNDDPFRFLGLPTILRARASTTRGAFGLVEQVMLPGFASPYHVHHREDEAFYVLEGQMRFVCGGVWMAAGPGTFVFGPREVAHGFKVVGESPARMLLLCTPGGFEQFVLDLSEPEPAPGAEPAPPDMARLAAVAAKYAIDILGPLPDEAFLRSRAAENRIFVVAFTGDHASRLAAVIDPLGNYAWRIGDRAALVTMDLSQAANKFIVSGTHVWEQRRVDSYDFGGKERGGAANRVVGCAGVSR